MIQVELEAGTLHNLHTKFPNRGNDDLRIFCPSCSEVGVNITPEEVRLTPAILR